MEPGFVKADSTNLPKADVFMVLDFLKGDDRFNVGESRGVKTSVSARESYGYAAIGYVCLWREGKVCTVKGKVRPEHRVRSKSYDVSVIVNDEDNVVQDVQCHECAASSGGCKHSVAFLMWIHRKTESPSPTEVQCYWKRSALSTVGTVKKAISTNELCGTSSVNAPSHLPDNFLFLRTVLETAKEKKLVSALTGHNYILPDDLGSLSSHQLLISFIKHGGLIAADDFLTFASTRMENNFEQVELRTQDQKDNLLWHELRYGRITASKIYEAAHCRTDSGSLVRHCIGTTKIFDSLPMQRGPRLEKEVLSVLQKKVNKKFKKCGLMLSPKFPVLGASPDAISDEFVVEVKCPSSTKTEKNYLPDGKIRSKCMAQIQLQMFMANKKKGLFCVADPKFEENKNIKYFWIEYNENYTSDLINLAMNFWKKKYVSFIIEFYK